MALTDLTIRRAKAQDKPYKLYDSHGLFLLVDPSGSKLWRQKFKVHGKERLLTHGAYPKVSLKKARLKRNDVQEQLDAGVDPSVKRKLDKIEAEAVARNTFNLVAEEYIQVAHDRELADATMRKKIWHVETLAAPLHNRAICDITSAEVLDLLRKVERSGRRETAKNLRGTLSAVFWLAVVTLRADNDPTQAIKGALLPVKVTNRAAITDKAVLGQFLRDLEAYSWAGVVKDALLFQILTMTRPRKARGARKTEIDFAKRTWTIPAERMNMRRHHVVPLSNAAIELVQRNWMDATGVELVFHSLNSTRKQLSENAFNSVLRRLGHSKEDSTAHGFWATASTLLNGRGYDAELVEAALARKDSNAVWRAYNQATYLDQRVELMNDWAALFQDLGASG